MSELFKQRIFIKDGKISHYLERVEYPYDETLIMVGFILLLNHFNKILN